MVMSTNRSWSAFIFIIAFLLAGSLVSATAEVAASSREISGSPNAENAEMRLPQQRENRPGMDSPAVETLAFLQEPRLPGDEPEAGRMRTDERPQQVEPFAEEPAADEQPMQEQQPATVPAARTPQKSMKQSGNMLKLTLNDVELVDFIQQISELLDLKPILIDPDVQGTVTINSGSLSKDDVLSLFHLILKTKNVAMIRNNGIYQVVPISSAPKTGVDLVEHPAPDQQAEPGTKNLPGKPAAGRRNGPEPARIPDLATHVVRLEFLPVKDMIEPIKWFMSSDSIIMSYERLNMLILTDYSDNIDRILKIVHMLDNNFMNPDLIDLVKIHNNNSADVAEDLKKIFGGGEKDSATGISFVSLDRLNAIFVMASSKRGLEEVKRWIAELDTTTGRSRQTNVYNVQKSTASNIATLLAALYGDEGTTQTQVSQPSSESGGSQQGGTGLESLFGGNNSGRGSFGSYNNSGSGQYNSQGGLLGGGYLSGGQQLSPQFNASRGISKLTIKGGEFSGLQDTVRLVVDDVNNSLIIISTAADYTFILETIKKMDVMPRQVVIDARIFEVDLTDDLNYGVGAALQERTGGSLTEFTMNTSVSEGIPTGALVARNIALVGDSQQLLTALNALREKTNVKILESPSLLALDGTEAYITVGAEVPYPGTSYTQAVGGTTTSVQYRDTGVTLYVRPRISASGSVSLEVLQEVSGVGASTSLGPTFSKSRVRTNLSVRDGETVAIAGLIRNSNSWTRTGFPLISDIPIIGDLFGQTNRNNKRSELIILLSPHVVSTPDEFKTLTQEMKNSLRNVRKFIDEKDQERVDSLKEAEIEQQKKAEAQRLQEERQKQQEEKKNKKEKKKKK